MPVSRGAVPLGGGGDEADATNTKGFNIPNLNASANVKLPDLEGVTASVRDLNTALTGLQTVLRGFGTSSGNALNNVLKQITTNATAAAGAVAGVAGSVGSPASAGGPAPASNAPGSAAFGSSGSWFSGAAGSVAGRLTGGIASASTYLTGFSNPLVGMGMGTLRFLRDRIATNRNLSIQSGSDFGMVSRQQGTSIENIMGQVGRLPGGVMGTPQDLLSLFSNAPMYGASFAFGASTSLRPGADRLRGQGVRARGMLEGIREAQMMNPGAQVGQIMQDIGGFAANTQAQQQGAYLTGGAYSIIGAGGRQKSISEWAESILKWLQGLRGGANKDKPFDYGELMSQYFPGSNIDAWFSANGVPQAMRNYWWTYALEKANKGNRTDFKIGGDDTNVAYRRLQASTALTQTEFGLGSAMTGAYLNKEQANRWFNEFFGQAQQKLIPAVAGSPLMSWISSMPDTMEDLLMTGVEGLAKGMFGDVEEGIGDSGMYGSEGGTGLAGMSLNMKSKLGPMMRANPRLKVRSGLRDNAMQKRLKGKGYSRVSGGPSAHTRGDAADLGPSSEYGWLMKNAKKFGLKSGKSQGEPWHVGVGDIFDNARDLPTEGNDPLSLMGALTSTFGSDPTSMTEWIAQVLGQLFGKLQGFIGGSKAPTYDAGLYDRLVNASMGKKFGMPVATPTPPRSRPNIPYDPDFGYTPPNPIGGGTGSELTNPLLPSGDTTWGAMFRDILGGMGLPVTGSNLTKLAMVVQGEGGGGDFNPFNYVTPAPGSTWYNTLPGGGHVQNYPDWNTGVQMSIKLLNQKSGKGDTRALKANLANQGSYKDWYQAVENFYAGWGGDFPNNISESTANRQLSNPTWGVGDMDMEMMRMSSVAPPSRQAPVLFNNTFHIGGNNSNGVGGIDVRRTVTLIADQLEGEMNKRLSRVN